jgi:hypothetical protein
LDKHSLNLYLLSLASIRGLKKGETAKKEQKVLCCRV